MKRPARSGRWDSTPRADLIAVMTYTFSRVSAMVGMRVEDYFQQSKRWWFRLHEKGGKYHEVPDTIRPKSTWTPGSMPRASARRRNCPCFAASTARTVVCGRLARIHALPYFPG